MNVRLLAMSLLMSACGRTTVLERTGKPIATSPSDHREKSVALGAALFVINTVDAVDQRAPVELGAAGTFPLWDVLFGSYRERDGRRLANVAPSL